MPYDEGVIREAGTSLYSLFQTTRQILREAGSCVGIANERLGGIAIAVLNRGLRPFLSYWHPVLQAWEAQRPPGANPWDHEEKRTEEERLRKELEKLLGELKQYVDALGKIAGIRSSGLAPPGDHDLILSESFGPLAKRI